MFLNNSINKKSLSGLYSKLELYLRRTIIISTTFLNTDVRIGPLFRINREIHRNRWNTSGKRLRPSSRVYSFNPGNYVLFLVSLPWPSIIFHFANISFRYDFFYGESVVHGRVVASVRGDLKTVDMNERRRHKRAQTLVREYFQGSWVARAV